MSAAPANNRLPEYEYSHLVTRTIEACQVAKDAAATAAEGIATGSSSLLNSLREKEKQLDTLDREIDDGVTLAITQVTEPQARELLACMKFMIGLERIGDLLLSFASSAQAAGGRVDPQDTRDLTHMATVLEKMLADVGLAFSTRDVKKAVEVLHQHYKIPHVVVTSVTFADNDQMAGKIAVVGSSKTSYGAPRLFVIQIPKLE